MYRYVAVSIALVGTVVALFIAQRDRRPMTASADGAPSPTDGVEVAPA
jgi:hypothetical protein